MEVEGAIMSSRKVVLSVAAALAAIAAGFAAPAIAATSAATPVTYQIQSVTGDVLVLRGNQVYSVQAGDILQAGDQVFTRSQAATVIQQLGTCTLPLPGASSVTIPAGSGTTCNITQQMVQSLSAASSVGGVTIGTATGVGAAAPVVAALGALGVGAAAVGGGGGPASP
jgi:hypothetical protein